MRMWTRHRNKKPPGLWSLFRLIKKAARVIERPVRVLVFLFGALFVALFHCVFDISGHVMSRTFGPVELAFCLQLFVARNLAGRVLNGALCFFGGAFRRWENERGFRKFDFWGNNNVGMCKIIICRLFNLRKFLHA